MKLTFSYRGFDCLLIPVVTGFGVAVLNKGNPLRVEWNGRTEWHSRRRAKTMGRQFINKKIPVTTS